MQVLLKNCMNRERSFSYPYGTIGDRKTIRKQEEDSYETNRLNWSWT